MSVWLWALAGAAGAGVAGWKLGRASGLLTATLATTRPTEHLPDPDDPGHEGCRQANQILARALAAHIAHIALLEGRLAAYDRLADLEDEHRRLLDGGGGGS